MNDRSPPAGSAGRCQRLGAEQNDHRLHDEGDPRLGPVTPRHDIAVALSRISPSSESHCTAEKLGLSGDGRTGNGNWHSHRLLRKTR